MKRVAYLDGLRGFAALQVVVMHYVLAFAPAIGNIAPAVPHPAWEHWFIHSPLFFFADGYVAVSIFFLISGTVLTYSFEASGRSFSTQVARRIIRLGLPMAASILLGAIWYFSFPQAHLQAAAFLQNTTWLGQVGPAHPRIGAVLKELCTALLFGHAHFSLVFPGMLGERVGLMQLSQSFNAPLWTLHLELYGSFIVLLLVVAERTLSRFWHRLVCIVAACGLIAHPLGLFVIGYLAAKMLSTSPWQTISASKMAKMLGCAGVILGVSMSAHVAPAWFMRAYGRFTWFEKLPMKADDFHFFSQYGAMLIFFGILVLPGFQRVLGAGLGRVLGKYSFSVYLVHFPILLTLTSFLTVRFAALGQGAAFCAASVIGLGVTALLTFVFERWVDRPATELSRRIRVFEGKRMAAAPRRAAPTVALSEAPGSAEG
jgi:peptidoglycan/LPS O-acetylase OafA/YrhL